MQVVLPSAAQSRAVLQEDDEALMKRTMTMETRRAPVGTPEQHSSEAARAPAVLADEQASLHSVNRQSRASKPPSRRFLFLFRLSLEIRGSKPLDA